MKPGEQFAATLLDVAPELTPVQYEVITGAAEEYAAAMIERHAHPPLARRLAAGTVQQGGAA